MKKSLLFVLVSLPCRPAGTLLPPGSADQSPSRLQAAPVPTGAFETSRWRSPGRGPVGELVAPEPYMAESREFWAVGCRDSRRMAIDTSAPGAVIRVVRWPQRRGARSSLQCREGGGPGTAVVPAQGLGRPVAGGRMDVPEGSAIVHWPTARAGPVR